MIWFLEKSLVNLLEHYSLLSTTLLNHQETNRNLLELNQNKQLIFQIYQKKTFPLTLSKKYVMIEEFNDEIKGWKNTLNEIKKIELFREQEINEIKNETRGKLNLLDGEINDILKKSDVDLTTLIITCNFFDNPYEYNFIEEQRELRIAAKERINEIKRLKEETKINKDE